MRARPRVREVSACVLFCVFVTSALNFDIVWQSQEWRALNGFRCNMVYAKENYMEYIIIIQYVTYFLRRGILKGAVELTALILYLF